MSQVKSDHAIGIDEVGRGALAGPLVVVAAWFPPEARSFIDSLKLNDSKKLTYRRRVEIYKAAKDYPGLRWAAARVSPGLIDRLNVSQAANLAASRALCRLMTDPKIRFRRPAVILDGGLYLKNDFLLKNGIDSLRARTLIKADQNIRPVMLASIIAKVIRDRRMEKFYKLYPQYGFEIHKGYGTRAHILVLKQNGFTEIHRRSFKISQFEER